MVDLPKFLKELNSVAGLFEGQPAHLEAHLTPVNDPNLKISWLKDGKPLGVGSRFCTVHDFGLVTLDILYTLPEDQGTYTCVASNELGQAQTTGSIEVQGIVLLNYFLL